MKIVWCLLVGACLPAVSFAQTAAQPQTPATAPTSTATQPVVMHFSPGTLIRAQLETPIDAKRARVGDQVLARTTDDLNSVPPGIATKGCTILGHIVEVSPHQGASPSKLRIVFDKMILKNDSGMALPATIQAVGFKNARLKFGRRKRSKASFQLPRRHWHVRSVIEYGICSRFSSYLEQAQHKTGNRDADDPAHRLK
jgi:hypothetical protein